ncbi:unnamed protein product, partial [Meganyctiphanes norvegica]
MSLKKKLHSSGRVQKITRLLRHICHPTMEIGKKVPFFIQNWPKTSLWRINIELSEQFFHWLWMANAVTNNWLRKSQYPINMRYATGRSQMKVVGSAACRRTQQKFLLAMGYKHSLRCCSTACVISVPNINKLALLAYNYGYLLNMSVFDMAILSLYANKIKKSSTKYYIKFTQYANFNQFLKRNPCYKTFLLLRLSMGEVEFEFLNVFYSLIMNDKASYQLFEGANPLLPCASSAVELRHSRQMGRYCVANQAIPAGKVIFAEEPISAVLKENRVGSHCNKCFEQVVACVPCFTCCNVIFCSKKCRDTACATYHQWECKFVDFIRASGISQNAQLALRMITERGPKFFKDKENRYKYKEESTPIPTANAPFKSHDYVEQMKGLVALEHERRPTDFIQRTLMACLLLKVLQKADFFGKGACNPDTVIQDLTEDELFVGQLLLRELQILQFNAHEVSAITLTEGATKIHAFTTKSIITGLAVYSTVALLNHSCYPAVSRYDNTYIVSLLNHSCYSGVMRIKSQSYKLIKDVSPTGKILLAKNCQFSLNCLEFLIDNIPVYEALSISVAKKNMHC